MGTVNVTLGEDTRLNLILGQQLENAVTSVVFDFSAWQTTYGSGTLALSVQRPGDEMPYAVSLSVSGTDATWSITELDTAYKGTGEIQLTYTVGTAKKKSVIYKFTVYESLGANGEYPSPGQTWQEEIEDDITDLRQDLAELEGGGVPTNVRQALYELLDSAGFGEADVSDALAIVESWASAVTSITLNQSSISISGSGTYQLVATTTPSGGAVTWSSSDTSVATVSSNGLVTSVGNGTATITASSGNVSATCTATITGFAELSSISAVYTQSGTVYDTDSLDDLRTDLVVTATYSDSSTATITDYTLSGTLTEGTSTIVVSYGGKTTTFTVTVSHDNVPYVSDGLFAYWDAIDNQATGTHDSSATTWVDLINGHTWSAVKSDGTQTWSWANGNSLNFNPASSNNTARPENVFLCQRPGTGLRTLEIVFTPDAVGCCVGEFTSDLTGATDTSVQIIGIASSDNTFIIQGTQNGYSAGDVTAIKSITGTYGSSYAPVKAYMNGAEVTTRGSSHSYKYHTNANMVLGSQNATGGYYYAFKGKIHAIRMYSKELTAEEIAQNYSVDVTRFGLGA